MLWLLLFPRVPGKWQTSAFVFNPLPPNKGLFLSFSQLHLKILCKHTKVSICRQQEDHFLGPDCRGSDGKRPVIIFSFLYWTFLFGSKVLSPERCSQQTGLFDSCDYVATCIFTVQEKKALAFCWVLPQESIKTQNNYFWIRQHELTCICSLFTAAPLWTPLIHPDDKASLFLHPAEHTHIHTQTMISPARRSSPHPDSGSHRSHRYSSEKLSLRNSKNKQSEVDVRLSSHIKTHHQRSVSARVWYRNGSAAFRTSSV